MKRITKLNLFTFFTLIIYTNVQAETLLLKSDKWCPYVCNPNFGQYKQKGYAVEVAKVIFERKGHNIDFQIDNWTNSIDSVRMGVAAGLVATTKSDAPDFIYPKTSIGINHDCFYVRARDPWEFINIGSLKKKKIGIVESYAYSPELMSFLNENRQNVTKIYGDNPLQLNLKNLDDKKIDILVENPSVFNYYTENKKIRDHYEEAGCTSAEPLYIGFSPKNPRSKEFAKILDLGIEELRKDGTLGKILQKYSLKDWSP